MRTTVIEVRGGVVQNVYSDDAKQRIVILDWDEQEAGGLPVFEFPVSSLTSLDRANPTQSAR